MVAQHVDSKDWVCWQEFTASTKFRGKYLQVIPLGICHLVFRVSLVRMCDFFFPSFFCFWIHCIGFTRIALQKSDNHYTWRKVTTTVNNMWVVLMIFPSFSLLRKVFFVFIVGHSMKFLFQRNFFHFFSIFSHFIEKKISASSGSFGSISRAIWRLKITGPATFVCWNIPRIATFRETLLARYVEILSLTVIIFVFFRQFSCTKSVFLRWIYQHYVFISNSWLIDWVYLGCHGTDKLIDWLTEWLGALSLIDWLIDIVLALVLTRASDLFHCNKKWKILGPECGCLKCQLKIYHVY